MAVFSIALIACLGCQGQAADALEPRGTEGLEHTQRQSTTVTPPPQIHENGTLCGDPGLVGAPIRPIRGWARFCDVREPVQIWAVAGVGLSRPVNLDCRTARALRIWVERDVAPSFEALGGGIAELVASGSYACRSQNNIPGAPLSLHGRGQAIDISGFVLKNGQRLSVAAGWTSKGLSGIFRYLHAAACEAFGTVLGPNADSYHRDHFHLDTKPRLTGGVCR